MKKIYLQPLTTLFHVELQAVIAGSPLTVDSNGDVTEGEFQDKDATGPGLSRRRTVWGNENENEEEW